MYEILIASGFNDSFERSFQDCYMLKLFLCNARMLNVKASQINIGHHDLMIHYMQPIICSDGDRDHTPLYCKRHRPV